MLNPYATAVLHFLLVLLWSSSLPIPVVTSFAIRHSSIPSRMSSSSILMSSSSIGKDLYGIPNSRWTSPEWNWGYAVGTGHDCAAICRTRWSTKSNRSILVDLLLSGGQDGQQKAEEIISVDEVKLILALKIQRGRWDGSDGGPNGGYGEVMSYMAQAKRYERDDIGDSSGNRQLIQDMKDRFHLLNPTKEDLQLMESLWNDGMLENQQDVEDVEKTLLKCSGLVLKAMGFIENGI